MVVTQARFASDYMHGVRHIHLGAVLPFGVAVSPTEAGDFAFEESTAQGEGQE